MLTQAGTARTVKTKDWKPATTRRATGTRSSCCTAADRAPRAGATSPPTSRRSPSTSTCTPWTCPAGANRTRRPWTARPRRRRHPVPGRSRHREGRVRRQLDGRANVPPPRHRAPGPDHPPGHHGPAGGPHTRTLRPGRRPVRGTEDPHRDLPGAEPREHAPPRRDHVLRQGRVRDTGAVPGPLGRGTRPPRAPAQLRRGLPKGAPLPIWVKPELLPGIKVPTLLIHGRDDRVVPFENSLHLLANIPDSRLVLLNRCGHWAMIEHADEFNRLVTDFLRHAPEPEGGRR